MKGIIKTKNYEYKACTLHSHLGLGWNKTGQLYQGKRKVAPVFLHGSGEIELRKFPSKIQRVCVLL